MEQKEILKQLQQDHSAYTPEIQTYVNCMYEIISRTTFIHDYITGNLPTLPKDYMYQLICLQFRAVAELIVLSSLVANQKEYIRIKEKITLEYRPKQLNEYLKSINKNYFPVAQELIEDEKGMLCKPLHERVLTIADTEAIFNLCSNAIHPKHPFKPDGENITLQTFNEWCEKIVRLLSFHWIMLKGTEKGLSVFVDFKGNTVKFYLMFRDVNKMAAGRSK